jgi:hypothetical protein
MVSRCCQIEKALKVILYEIKQLYGYCFIGSKKSSITGRSARWRSSR